MKKRNLCLLFLLCSLLVSIFPISTNAAGDSLLGRNRLASLPNGADLVWLYDEITRAVEQMEPSISINDQEHPMYDSDFEIVYAAYTGDHGEQFWFNQIDHYTVGQNTNHLVGLDFSYADTIFTQRDTFDRKLAALYASAGITASMSDYDKALRLHDALIAAVCYSETENAHSAYGAVVDGTAVCDGYTEAYQILLRKAGIESYKVTGSIRKTDGQTESHAWTLARIDGDYCYIDTTWDDVDSDPTAPYYAYFGLTDAQIGESHAPEVPAFGLPAATSARSNYFARNGGIIASSGDMEEVVKQLKTSTFARVYVSGNDPMQICQWYQNNIRDIAGKAGFDLSQKINYGYSAIGREFHLIINGERKAPETDPPETKAPETKAPETKVPETKLPETKTPETKAPETKAPETKTPETKAPETKAPETKAPETKAPETKAPETKVPETKVPETKVPETKLSETKTPETKAPETKTPETKSPETKAPETKTGTETSAPTESETSAPSKNPDPKPFSGGNLPIFLIGGIVLAALVVVVVILIKKKHR